MKTQILILACAAMIPMTLRAETLGQEARDTWDTTKHVTRRASHVIEDGARDADRTVVHEVDRVRTERRMSIPDITITRSSVAMPTRIPPGSDLLVTNRADIPESVEVRGLYRDDRTFLSPGQTRRVAVDLPEGNYQIITSDSGSFPLRVR